MEKKGSEFAHYTYVEVKGKPKSPTEFRNIKGIDLRI